MADQKLIQIGNEGNLNPDQAHTLEEQLKGEGTPYTRSQGNNGTYFKIGSPTPAAAPAAAAPDNSANEAKQTALFTQGKSDITDFLSRYKSAVPNIIDTTSTKYNIPGQITNVNALNTRIKNLQGNLDNSGSGGYSSGQQVDAAINSRYMPTYNTAMTNLLTSGTQAQTEEAAQIQPYQTEGTLLNDRLAREATGFSTQQQRELDTYLAQLDSGTKLSIAQIQAANELAKAKIAYDQAIQSATITNNKVQSVGAGSYVYDPATGSYKKLS